MSFKFAQSILLLALTICLVGCVKERDSTVADARPHLSHAEDNRNASSEPPSELITATIEQLSDIEAVASKHSHLTTLILREGRVPEGTLRVIAGMRNLRKLVFDGVDSLIDADLTMLEAIGRLQMLEFIACRELNGEFLANVARCKTLQSLKLHDLDKIEDGSFEALTVSNLTVLHVTGCDGLSGAFFSSTAKLAHLEQFRISRIRLSDTSVAQLSAASRLRKVDLSGCTGISAFQVKCLLSIPLLEALGLDNMPLDGEVCSEISRNGQALRFLSVVRCELDDAAMEVITFGLPALVSLSCGMNPLTDRFLLRQAMPLIEMLSMFSCPRITDDGVIHVLQKSPKLAELDLAGCGVTNALLKIKEIGLLRYLSVAYCAAVSKECVQEAQTRWPQLEIIYR